MAQRSISRCWVMVGVLALAAAAHAQEVVTILGTGEAGWSGDGGQATAAKCGGPFGLVIGPDDAVYVCETSSHVIRRIDPQTQIVSTVAGTGGKSGHAGDGGPATQALLNEPYEVRFDTDGNMYIVEMKGEVVRRVNAQTGIISTIAGNGTAGSAETEGQRTKPN